MTPDAQIAPAAAPLRESSLRDFFAVVFRRFGVVLGSFLAAAAVVFFMNAARPVLFESTSRIIVSRGQQESAYTSRQKPLVSWEEELNSELETIMSAHILERAQKMLADNRIVNEAGSPLELDVARVNAVTTGKSSVIYVSYRDHSAAGAREGCRAITQAYIDFRQQVRAVPEVDRFFREEIEGLREQLEDWENKRAEFMSEESVVRIPEERQSLLAVRQETELQLNRVRADLAELEARVEVLRSQMRQNKGEDPYAFSDAETDDDEAVFKVKQELIQARTAYVAARSEFTDEHPDVQAFRSRVQQLEEALRSELNAYLSHLGAKVEVLKAREEALLGTLHYVDSELAGFPSKEARLAGYDRIIDALKTDYNALVEKEIQARIERTGTSDWNVIMLQPANKARALRTNDYVRLAIIPLLSLLAGVAVAFAIDGLDHSLKDATEVENHLNVPVLGSVGRLR